MVKNSLRLAFWVIAPPAIALLAAFLVCTRRVSSYEVSRVHSPDGTTDAVLVAIPRDAAGARSYKVCFQRPNGLRLNPTNCNEIAYLAGVSASGVSKTVSLVWTAPSQLEIRYASATSIHVYKPVFVWGAPHLGAKSGPYGVGLPIFTRAVPTVTRPSESSAVTN